MELKRKSAALFDALSTQDLEQLLRNDCDGTRTLAEADILAICQILAQRSNTSRSAQTAWQQFLRCYAPWNNDE